MSDRQGIRKNAKEQDAAEDFIAASRTRVMLRDPLPGRDLPRCICGEEVCAPHTECRGLWQGVGND